MLASAAGAGRGAPKQAILAATTFNRVDMDKHGSRLHYRLSLAALASLAYAALGAIWITVSDRVAEALIPEVAQLTLVPVAKGWLFVAVSALAMYLLMRRTAERRAGDCHPYRRRGHRARAARRTTPACRW